VSAEDQARGEGDDHHRDVVELARAIGTTVEDDRGGEDEQANHECDTRLDQTHTPTTGQGMAEINCFSLPIFAHGSDIGAASRSAKLVTIKAFESDSFLGLSRKCPASIRRLRCCAGRIMQGLATIALAKAVADG
jgi:hypothetical protein